MRHLIVLSLILLAGCGGSSTSPLRPPELPPREIRVIDADTIDIDGTRYRLHGIDAPESYQTCRAWGHTWECGKAATHALLSHTADISCTGEESDRYGRTVGRCSTPRGLDVNAWLVSQGWALAVYSDDYRDEEAQARAQRLGIHRGAFVHPADRRKGQRLPGQDTLAGDATIALDLAQVAEGLLWGTASIDGQLLQHSAFGLTDAGAAFSLGDWQATNPSLAESATWTGQLAAISQAGSRTTGAARLTVQDLADPEQFRIDLALSGPDLGTLNWSDIPLQAGAFHAGDGSMRGRFYGPEHDEAGGIFDRDGWRGAFGVSR